MIPGANRKYFLPNLKINLNISRVGSHRKPLLSQQGTIGFEAQIDKCLELSEYLYNKIKDREGYEMVFNGKVRSRSAPHSPHNRSKRSSVGLRHSSHLGVVTGDLIGTRSAPALCWTDAIVTSSLRYNVQPLCLMNRIRGCNC